MNTLTVVDLSGTEHLVPVQPGLSLMEAIRDAGISDLKAACGGFCSCATCHVYVGADHTVPFSVIADDEDELLSESAARRPASRLSCQIKVSPELAGMPITVAPGD